MKTIKNTLLLIIILCTSAIQAQEVIISDIKGERKDGFGIGFKLNQVKQDFGLGIDLSSPLFLHNSLGLRLHTLYFFREYYNPDEDESVWTPYFTGRFGFVGIGGRPHPAIRLYGEGGIIFGIPDAEFSSQSNFFGGYGLFGFEFFMSEGYNEVASYYIELGGTGTGAEADKLPGKVIYQNGFTIGTGFRLYF